MSDRLKPESRLAYINFYSGDMVTEEDHKILYKELKDVLYRRMATDTMSPAQLQFVSAFEQACMGTDFLECYAGLVDREPGIPIRHLHAFCLGFSLGKRHDLIDNEDNKTFH